MFKGAQWRVRNFDVAHGGNSISDTTPHPAVESPQSWRREAGW